MRASYRCALAGVYLLQAVISLTGEYLLQVPQYIGGYLSRCGRFSRAGYFLQASVLRAGVF
jgi:hypothetical protein